MTAELTLGPLLLHWPGEQWRDFYFRMADEAPVDTVYLGEVVCPKRWPFNRPYLEQAVDRLQASGKAVVLSTPALVAEDQDLELVRELAGHGLPVEANDVATLGVLQRDGREAAAAGPMINTYNEATLAHLAAQGVQRVVPPAELPGASIRALAGRGRPMLEVQAFGRWPLAISARCYHARAYGRTKATCQYACGDDPDGLPVDTLDDEPFLTVNGVQTLSRSYACLAAELGELRAAGVGAFRLTPQSVDMAAVARLYRELLDGRRGPDSVLDTLEDLCGEVPLANGYYHETAGALWLEE